MSMRFVASRSTGGHNRHRQLSTNQALIKRKKFHKAGNERLSFVAEGEDEEGTNQQQAPTQGWQWMLSGGVAVSCLVVGCILFLVSPHCSQSSDQLCLSSKNMRAVFDRARSSGENEARIKWIYALRYVGSIMIGAGIFYLLLMFHFQLWAHRHNCPESESSSKETPAEVQSKLTIYDVMVRAWVTEHCKAEGVKQRDFIRRGSSRRGSSRRLKRSLSRGLSHEKLRITTSL